MRKAVGMFDVCVLADCVYYENEPLFAHLVATLCECARDIVLVCYRERKKECERVFFELMFVYFECTEKLVLDEKHQLFVFQKKKI
jgi:hypothetical protein